MIVSLQDVFREMRQKPRTGWVDHQIQNPETVWQHSAALRKITLDLAPIYLGGNQARQHCAKMAVAHDCTEGIAPDITPHMGITEAQKEELEMIAIHHIGKLSPLGARLKALWLEYQTKQTDCAKFVSQLDKIQLLQKALQYELNNASPFSLQPFWDGVQKRLVGAPLMHEWENLHKQRPILAKEKPLLVRNTIQKQSFEDLKDELLRKIGASQSS